MHNIGNTLLNLILHVELLTYVIILVSFIQISEIHYNFDKKKLKYQTLIFYYMIWSDYISRLQFLYLARKKKEIMNHTRCNEGLY